MRIHPSLYDLDYDSHMIFYVLDSIIAASATVLYMCMSGCGYSWAVGLLSYLGFGDPMPPISDFSFVIFLHAREVSGYC